MSFGFVAFDDSRGWCFVSNVFVVHVQDSDELAKIGSKCFALVIQTIGPLLDSVAWHQVLESLHTVVHDTLPVELSGPAARQALGLAPVGETGTSASSVSAVMPALGSAAWRLRPVMTKCTVQHMLLDVATDLFRTHCSRLSMSHVEALLTTLRASIDFARSFNSDHELRRRLWIAGFRDHQKSVPDLFYQEAHGLAVYASILLRLYQLEHTHPATAWTMLSGESTAATISAAVEQRLLGLYTSVWAEFSDKDRINRLGTVLPVAHGDGAVGGGAGRAHDDELRCKEPVAALLLTGLKEWSVDQWTRHLPNLLAPSLALIEVESMQVRKALREVLGARLPNSVGMGV